MNADPFATSFAAEVVRLMDVAFEHLDHAMAEEHRTARNERIRIALNAVARVRDIAERFTLSDDDADPSSSL